MGRHITILGMGPSANERRHDIARYVDGEVWSLNNAFGFFPAFRGYARWYELHNVRYLLDWASKQPGGVAAYFERIDALGVPVYCTQSLPIIRQQVAYPELSIAVHFGSNYWDGTPTRMLAHAIYEHDAGHTVDCITTYGIDMQDTQHQPQFPAWTYWLRAAQERGIVMRGTAMARMEGVESDEGTRHLRPIIGPAMMRAQEQINSHGTDTGASRDRSTRKRR